LRALIVAMTRNGVIGNDGKLIWRIPEDMKKFKQTTSGNTVIMGRKTWDSLSDKYKPLPNRNNIVVSNSMPSTEGIEVARTIEEAVELAEAHQKKIFFIGGRSIYAEALPLVRQMHVSWVHKNYQGNEYFPPVLWDKWRLVDKEEFKEFTYTRYERR
jgi:dihydrofolate reductase